MNALIAKQLVAVARRLGLEAAIVRSWRGRFGDLLFVVRLKSVAEVMDCETLGQGVGFLGRFVEA